MDELKKRAGIVRGMSDEIISRAKGEQRVPVQEKV
jgi:hypothetical protein